MWMDLFIENKAYEVLTKIFGEDKEFEIYSKRNMWDIAWLYAEFLAWIDDTYPKKTLLKNTLQTRKLLKFSIRQEIAIISKGKRK